MIVVYFLIVLYGLSALVGFLKFNSDVKKFSPLEKQLKSEIEKYNEGESNNDSDD